MAFTLPPLTLLTTFLFIFISQILAQSTPAAPAPSPPSSGINLTAILVQGGQYTTLLRLLNETHTIETLQNQLINNPNGLTLFSPTDNAFNLLKAGALNGLSDQEKVQLLLYHVVPQFYTLTQLLTVSNPLRTEATGSDGVWGLNFTGSGNQVNVSSGVVTVPINNPLRQITPLSVFSVDQVLLPEQLFGNKTATPAASPAPKTSPSTSNGTNSTTGAADSPGTGAGMRNGVGMSFAFGLGLLSIGLLS